MYDIQGKLIQSSKLNKGQSLTYLDVQTLYAGAYLIKIAADGKELTKKIMIEK